MSEPTTPPQRIFDGHNDTMLRLWRKGDMEGRCFIEGDGEGHIDAPRARAGGFKGGFFALYAPNPEGVPAFEGEHEGDITNIPYIGPVDAPDAMRAATALASILARIARTAPDTLSVCRSVAEIEAAEQAGAIAAVMHIEGAEAIDVDLQALELFHAAGLRSLGPVWSRPNKFGFGVPFRFPADPDQGPGLTDHGVRLVRACEEMGIMVDLSHLNAAGFWDVAKLSTKPLVATHSNVHAISPSARNLLDKQLDAIAESKGVVGVNYAVGFLREDGRQLPDTPLPLLIRHLDHLLEKLGEDGVALGSDFDGAMVPREIGDAAGLPALVGAMRQAGYGPELIDKICWGNWLSLLKRTWK